MTINNTDDNLVRYKDKIWNFYQRTLIPVYPPHLSIELQEEECRKLIKIFNPYFIRWSSQWDCKENTGFWFIIKDRKEDIADYSSKIRNTIKKGIRLFNAKIISKELLKEIGFDVYLKALQRYQTSQIPFTEEQYLLQLDQLFKFGEWEFWGVFENSSGKMAGYSMNWIYDRSCEYKTIKLDPAFLKDSSSYLLIHEMNKHYLNDLQFLYVNDGSRSLMHESNIQEFLEKKFLFRKAYCRMHIHYRPSVSILVKALYPMKNIFFGGQSSISRKISTLLKHEEIVREYHLLGKQRNL